MNKRTMAVLAAALALFLIGGVYYGEREVPKAAQEATTEATETEGGIFLNGPGNGTYTGLEGRPYISYGLPKEVRTVYGVSRGTTDRPKSGEAGGAYTGGTMDGDDGATNSNSLGTFKLTAYTAGFESTGKRPGDPAYGITKSGATVQENHTIAADWSVLPAGTKVMIDGLDHVYTVEDIGGGVKGKHIDIYIADLKEALRWGVQEREVTIIEWGPGYEKEAIKVSTGDNISNTSLDKNKD